MLKKWFAILIISGGLGSCYYDNEEELYPLNPGDCDTVSVTYSKTVQPMLVNQCYVCHSQASAQGGIVVEGHAKVKELASNGRLLTAISHPQGHHQLMPKNGQRLPDCTIRQIKAWIDKGAPND